MISLGIDPDLHHTALALLDGSRVVALRVVAPGGSETGGEAVIAMVRALALELPQWASEVPEPAACAIEAQKVYRGAQGRSDPADLLRLAQVAGAAAMACQGLWPGARLLMPEPYAWKGQVPKEIHQARTLARLGWEGKVAGGKSPYCVPTKKPASIHGAGFLKSSDWKHVLDAIGLALWAPTAR